MSAVFDQLAPPRPLPAKRASALTWRWLIVRVLVGLLAFLGVRTVVENYRVEGPSMQPTLYAGQFVSVNKGAYARVADTFLFGGPRRGDVVVLRVPHDPGGPLIKRVIGLPGDRVLVRRGEVLVNGQRISEPYVRFPANYTYPRDEQPLVVPDSHYFVLGDNRRNSKDSHLGWFVPAENLVGRAWATYWPPTAWSFLGPSANAGS